MTQRHDGPEVDMAVGDACYFVNRCIWALGEMLVLENVLTDDVVRRMDLNVNPKKARSFGGRKNGRAYISINVSYGSFGTPCRNENESIDLTKKMGFYRRTWAATNPRRKVTPSQKGFLWTMRQNVAGRYAFREYASVADDPDIGSFSSRDVRACWAVLVAHEMAHVVNYNSHRMDMRGQNHDDTWKKVYGILRGFILHDNFYAKVAELPRPDSAMAASSKRSR